MEKLLIKGLTIIAAGGCAFQAIRTIQKYRQAKEFYEVIEEEFKEEK